MQHPTNPTEAEQLADLATNLDRKQRMLDGLLAAEHIPTHRVRLAAGRHRAADTPPVTYRIEVEDLRPGYSHCTRLLCSCTDRDRALVMFAAHVAARRPRIVHGQDRVRMVTTGGTR